MASALPFVGGLISEIVTYTIPNQRADRFEQYLEQLCDRLRIIEQELLEQKVKEQDSLELFQDGANQAVHALPHERTNYIVSLVANGIATEERKKLQSRRLLYLLGQLDDEEVAILHGYSNWQSGELTKLRPEPATFGSTDEVIEQNALWDAAIAKLEALSLLRFTAKKEEIQISGPKRTAHVNVVDTFGNREGDYRVTKLGNMLLKEIGLKVEG